jgi:8-oxo-dGTP diphosphatase
MIMPIGRFYGGVGVLLYDTQSEEYLLLRRSASKDFAAGAWECVTGRVDQGEGFEDAAHREVWEELGIEVQLRFFVGTTHFYRGQERSENELIGVVYCATSDGAAGVRLSDEHAEGRWVTATEAEELLRGAHPSERWLLGVIHRAEIVWKLLPPELLALYSEQGFELDA